MADTAPIHLNRSDIDIEADIHARMTDYPPLSHDRHRVHISVEDGVVTVRGYVKTPPTARFLLAAIGRVDGVKAIISSDFHDDETIRLEVGRMIPMGIFVNVEYGALILAGQLPKAMTIETLVERVGRVPGVHRVVTTLSQEQ